MPRGQNSAASDLIFTRGAPLAKLRYWENAEILNRSVETLEKYINEKEVLYYQTTVESAEFSEVDKIMIDITKVMEGLDLLGEDLQCEMLLKILKLGSK